jgi:hypothetical protein
MTSTSVWVTIVAHRCGKCGVHFGLEQDFLDSRQNDGQTFYCPNGHPRVFRETEAQRLRKENERLTRVAENERQGRIAARELLTHETRSHAATRGHVTRKKKQLARVSAGVCPCCNRTFQNLARHMAGKHPDFTP